jgi:hypothetical protein
MVSSYQIITVTARLRTHDNSELSSCFELPLVPGWNPHAVSVFVESNIVWVLIWPGRGHGMLRVSAFLSTAPRNVQKE